MASCAPKSLSSASSVDIRVHSYPVKLAQTRFRFLWIWDGMPAVIQSRATDETGYSQPTHKQLVDERGPLESGSLFYHMNAIQSWGVAADGSVKNVHPFG
jgi:sulfane dehydrogenase subunit SoxC